MLEQPLAKRFKLTPRQAQSLQAAGITSCRDLLFGAPRRYEHFHAPQPIASLEEGQYACIEAVVLPQEALPAAKRLQISVQDAAGSLAQLAYFHVYPGLQAPFRPGRRGLFYGRVQRFRGRWQLSHPRIHWLDAGCLPPPQPHYGGNLPEASRRRWLEQLLEALPREEILNWPDLPSFREALNILHRPPLPFREEDLNAARERLRLEELYAQRCALGRLRERSHRAPSLSWRSSTAEKRAREALPFALTAAQERAAAEISADLSGEKAMWRLVQGDVGSGKTVLAWLAALQCAQAGRQALLLAPTTLLAQQHYASLQSFNRDGLNIVLLSSQDKSALAAIADGRAQIIVGTHAALEQRVQYAGLALQIIDEQQRFGVAQRLRLQERGGLHTLLMSATPIPRTLALAQYGDLKLSVLDERPPGRLPIETRVYSEEKRPAIIARLGAWCRAGKQAYWVAPAIAEDERLQDVQALQKQLQEALPGLRIGLVHGQMPARQRQSAMDSFLAGETAILVATTVIEVGVNVPRASLMVIEQAERFGLAQLHQLRGRVGRGSDQAYCLLLYRQLSAGAAARLQALREHEDGFALAELDWRLRGAGSLLGMQQAGAEDAYFARLPRDEALWQRAKSLPPPSEKQEKTLWQRWFTLAED